MNKRPPLLNRSCYLAGPIEHSGQKEPIDGVKCWRDDVTFNLHTRFGLDVFNPFADPKQNRWDEIAEAKAKGDYKAINDITKTFVRKDLSQIDHSDLLIAHVPKDVPTVGTVHEIISANNCKKPTLLVCPQGKAEISKWFYGFIDHRFMFGSWSDLYSFLESVQAGQQKNNDRFWRIYDMV